MPLESRTMRIVRNIAVVFEPELCRARQKNRRKFALYACNATQPHFLQQLARQESASVQDKYFSIPTPKAIIPMGLRAIPQIALSTAVCL
jgi:hypothetical protein